MVLFFWNTSWSIFRYARQALELGFYAVASHSSSLYMYIKGSKEEKKIPFLCCIKRRSLRCTKGPSKRIRSPRRRRRSYTMRCTWKSHLSLYWRRGEVLSCPKRYRSVELKVGTSFVHVAGSIPVGIASGTFGRNAKKKKRFNTQIANIYIYI